MRKDGVSHKTLSSISAAEIHAKPPTKKLWWVKKVFRRGQVSCMWGESGSGKTAVELDLELHLAAGLDWREHKASQCVVVHVAGEGSGVGIENRVKAWLKRHPEVEPKDVLFEAISDAVDLSNPDDVTALVALLKVIEEKYGMPVGLIVIDTLNATAGKFDENSSRDMGRYARAARSLRNGDDRHVCILHHCGKDRTKGLRGSTAILGFIDAEFEITGGRESWTGELTQPKEREGDPTVERWGFKKVAVDLYRDEDGDIVTAVVADEMLLAADPQKLSFAGASPTKFGVLLAARPCSHEMARSEQNRQRLQRVPRSCSNRNMWRKTMSGGPSHGCRSRRNCWRNMLFCAFLHPQKVGAIRRSIERLRHCG